MRNDERLRTIYEVMAPYIVRNEHNWRDYLAFASQFHKHSFDNILLVYAQDEDVSILATRKQWAAIGRNLIPRAKGVAVCVYRNAKLTLDYLFDVSQTTGKEIHPTDWQLSDEMKKALTERLSYAHGFPKQDFSQALYAMASESVAENYNHFLQELKQETKGHLFTEIPAGGFEAQYIQLLTDSISYFIGKKCHLPDEEIQLSDGMATVSHFNTLPLVAHLGTAVTALSKGILLEVERNIKIINRERMAQHEQTEYQSEIQGAGRDDASRSTNLQQQRSRSTSGQVRPDGPGIPQRESPGAIYDFENGWQSDGDHAPGTGRGDREDRSPDAANAPAGAASADRGHHGADATLEQSETDGGGSRTPERSPDSPLTEEQPNTEVAPSAAPVGEPSEKDGSFSVPAEQPTRHFTDAEVRRNYEYILTSTNLYPPELHSAVRSVLSEPPLNPDWSDKGRQIAALFTPYGDREYQGDLLYRTRLHGEDGISFFFDEGYTYIPWNGLAFLLDAMIEDGDYPNPVVEEQPDPIGDYNIPDEVDEMGGPHRQMTIGEADFDYVLDAVAYEAGETVVEPVKPQAIVQMENDTPAAGDEPASVPDENPPVVVEAPETALPTDTAEQPTPPPVKGNTTAHKNFRRFQELFPEIVSGQYEYLRLEAGEAYYPLVIHHKYGSHYCMEHYYMQNGDRMYDPYMDFQIDKEAGTLRAFSYENSGIGVYNEADPDDPAYEKAINGFNSFFATWLNNIRSQGYEPVRASMMVNDEEVDVDLRPAAEAVPVVEEEQPEQLSLLSLEMSTEDLLVERVMQRGPLTAGKKEQIYEFAQTHPTGSEFTAFLKKLYGYEGFSGDEMGVKYAMFNSEGVTIEWQDKQGETQETKLSWARAAGVVQRLVDEGRYLQTPVVSQPEQQDEVQPFSDQYRLLDRLCADCEYFLGAGQRAEKHLWAGSVDAQIEKMRELYAQLPEKPDWISLDIINAYARRMAAPEPVENTAEASPEETQILDEALDAHHGQIDMLMQAVRGELTVGTIRYSIFEGRPHISMIEVLEDYRRQGMLERQINDIENAIHEIKSENGENWSVKQMVIFRKNLDERLKKLSAEEKKDDLLTFEQLGVDMMMVDEAHFFKNCFVFTKLRNVAGITTSSSQRAFDMLLKCQYLQETNQGRGVVFATGTPISNSISELFVMQRYLQPQELERFGWSYFDTWIAHFAKKASVLELKPEGGGYRMRDRFVRFYNLPELMAVFREVADIKTADMLDIPGLPAVRTGKAEIVSVEATPAQQAIMADFILRAEAIRTGRVKPEEDNMLKLTGEARLMAIDPRLIRPDADGTGSKLSVCIEDVYQVWKDTAASASTQLVFCDVGTPKAGKFNVYDEIRNVLLAKGVPESEIAFVHDATSEAQRQELFERTRQGKVRILIGSTSKLGTGVNVQNKVISIDHLDCPWKPSDITQRNGRGVRQGNENPEIMIKQFVAKGTFDAYLWQIQEQKLRYITQILTGKHIARSCEDVDETVLSAAQFKAAATDNPMVAQKMELENRVTELKILRGAWSNEQLALEHKVNLTYPSRIREYEQKIERVTQDISLLGQTEGKDFSIVLDGKHYTERPAAGEAFALLYRMISEGRGKDEYEFEIGSYRGFSLFVNFNPFERDIILRGALLYGTDIGNSGQGTITRIENLAERIPNYLEDARRELKETQKQLAVAQQQVGQPFLYEEELSEKVAQLTEINTKLEFESLQESEVILDENGQRSDGEEDWDSERVPACASAEV